MVFCLQKYINRIYEFTTRHVNCFGAFQVSATCIVNYKIEIHIWGILVNTDNISCEVSSLKAQIVSKHLLFKIISYNKWSGDLDHKTYKTQ